MPRRKICSEITCQSPYYGKGSRCADCENEYRLYKQAVNGTKRQRYPKKYQDNRKRLLTTFSECQLQYAGICTGAAETADHIVPVSKGGSHEINNLRPACKSCNSSRGNRDEPVD